MFKHLVLYLVVLFSLVACEESIQDTYKGSITGTVRDAISQHTLADVSISVNNGSNVSTDSEGKYIITDLLPDNYDLVTKKHGYLDDISNVNVIHGMTVINDIYLMPVMPEGSQP